MCSCRTSLTSSKLAVSGSATTFVRGTMMSRTVLSPNSRTLWRSFLSSPWMTPSSAPRLKRLFISSSVRVGVFSGTPKSRSMPVEIRTRTLTTGESSLIVHAIGTATAREIETGEAAAIAFGVISAKTKSVSVEKRIAAGTPYVSPSHAVASAVASDDAAVMKRFCPIRIVASSRERMRSSDPRAHAARRSPFSRSLWRSIRESETSAVSAPAKNAERPSESARSTRKSRYFAFMSSFRLRLRADPRPSGRRPRARGRRLSALATERGSTERSQVAPAEAAAFLLETAPARPVQGGRAEPPPPLARPHREPLRPRRDRCGPSPRSLSRGEWERWASPCGVRSRDRPPGRRRSRRRGRRARSSRRRGSGRGARSSSRRGSAPRRGVRARGTRRSGQLSRQRTQEPHISATGSSGGRSTSVTISARRRYEPSSESIRQPFLPIQPSPAAAAKERSAMGVESTQTRQRISPPIRAAAARAARVARARRVPW